MRTVEGIEVLTSSVSWVEVCLLAIWPARNSLSALRYLELDHMESLVQFKIWLEQRAQIYLSVPQKLDVDDFCMDVAEQSSMHHRLLAVMDLPKRVKNDKDGLALSTVGQWSRVKWLSWWLDFVSVNLFRHRLSAYLGSPDLINKADVATLFDAETCVIVYWSK